MSIARLNPTYDVDRGGYIDAYMLQSENGEYVEYEDYCVEVERLKAQVDALKDLVYEAYKEGVEDDSYGWTNSESKQMLEVLK